MAQVRLPSDLPPMVASFLASCDEVLYVPSVGIAATALMRGKLTLLLGSVYARGSEAVQREILRHEVGHFCLMHMERKGDRLPEPWNVVCDAALHEVGCCDYALVDNEILRQMQADGKPVPEGKPSVTFERIGIPPMPPEFAYDILMKNAVIISIEGCGSMSHSSSDDSSESIVKGAITSMRVRDADPAFIKRLMSNMHASTGASGGRMVPDLIPPPPWIRETIVYLTVTMKRETRRRSWMREHRNMPEVLPGISRNPERACRIMIDASGSISEEQLRQFLSAVSLTPELATSDVVIFDSKWSEPIPVTNRQAIVDAVATMGGGTCIKAVGEAMRDPGVSTVWITDGYTGDGWPEPHTKPEVWCIWGDGPSPDHADVIRIPVG